MDVLRQLAAAIQARDLASARPLLDRAQRNAPDNPNTRMLAALLARLEGQPGRALEMLGALYTEFPRDAGVAFQYANCLKDAGDERAAGVYRGLLARRPEHADAAFNLANCLRSGDPREAGQWFLQAARHDPSPNAALLGALEIAIELARDDAADPIPAPLAPEVEASVSVICCSIQPERLARLQQNLTDLFGDADWELVHIGDARSLCEGYQRGIDKSRGELLVLCHDDIAIHAEDFRARLQAHLKHFDLIGPAGTTRCTGPAVFWSGPTHAHSWVIHRDGDALKPSLGSGYGPVVPGAQALDGLLIAGRRAAIEQVGFDATTFDGFHFYDLDFTYRAYRAGLRIGIAQDLLVEHHSRGGFDANWRHYAERFRAKFPELAVTAPSHLPALVEGAVDDEEHARRTYAWIARWIGEFEAP